VLAIIAKYLYIRTQLFRIKVALW